MTQTTSTTIAQAWNTQAPHVTALEAARHFHLPVIPLDSDKKPCKVGGFNKDGSPKRLAWKKYQTEIPHEKQINLWQAKYTPSAWAIVTGEISRIMVLDGDGKAGIDTFRRLGLLQHVRTGSGGLHIYFQHPGWHVPTLNSKSKKELGQRWPGLDIRADGGYAAFCGRNEQGQYTWLRDFQPEKLDILPDDLRLFLGLMYPPDEVKARQSTGTRSTRVEGDTLLKWALDRLAHVGRNDGGFELACQLRDNNFSESEAMPIMLEYARRVSPMNTKGQFEPYTDTETLASLRSAYTGIARQPWESTLPPEPIHSSVPPTHNGNGNNGNGSEPVPTDNAYRSFNLTDMGNAERLVARFGRDLRYCYDMKAWLTWNITQWKEDKDGHAERIAKKTVRLIYKEAGDVPGEDKESEARRKALASHAMRSESKKYIRDMLELAKSEEEIPIRREDLDTDPWLLNCSNGTLNLHTGRLGKHNRTDLITRCIPTAYTSGATCPLWLSFLDTIFNKDAALIRFIKRALGYALTGDTSEQCFFLLYGKGNNGKSTLLEVIQAILGEYAQSAEFKAFLSRDNEGIRNDIARMNGKRMVIAKESDKGKRLAEALVKQLTGGDTITARFLHQEYFDFKPQFKLFLAANHKPEIKGTDLGIWRRVRLIPFEVVIPEAEKDKDLSKKLALEAEGILAWLVEGCLEWQRDGLGVPEIVNTATTAYREEMDVIATFLSERISTEDTEAEIGATDLYKAYKTWCDLAGERWEKQTAFGTRLVERGYEKDKTRTGIVYKGLKLLPAEESVNSVNSCEQFSDNSTREAEHGKKTQKTVHNYSHSTQPFTLNRDSEYYLDMESWLVKSGRPRPSTLCSECGTDAWWPYWQRGERTWGCVHCNPSIANHR